MSSGWESQAENWVAWARTPGHDVFPLYATSFLDEVATLPGNGVASRTLEVGCGEGRVARMLLDRGHRVTALDLVPTLVRHAADADARASYVVGSGTRLPFADASFDAVVSYNALQAMTEPYDMRDAVAEAARVLLPGGFLSISVPHPFSDYMLVAASRGEDEVAASYFTRARVDGTVSRRGIEMTFYGRTHTLGDYAAGIEAAGLAIDRIREPLPAIDEASASEEVARWFRTPLFLHLRAVKAA